jgi:hypothetical protein
LDEGKRSVRTSFIEKSVRIEESTKRSIMYIGGIGMMDDKSVSDISGFHIDPKNKRKVMQHGATKLDESAISDPKYSKQAPNQPKVSRPTQSVNFGMLNKIPELKNMLENGKDRKSVNLTLGNQQYNLKLTPVTNKPQDLDQISLNKSTHPGFFKGTQKIDRAESPKFNKFPVTDETELSPLNLEKCDGLSGSFFGDHNIEFYDSTREVPIGQTEKLAPAENNELKVVSFMDAGGFHDKVPSDLTGKDKNIPIELQPIQETSIIQGSPDRIFSKQSQDTNSIIPTRPKELTSPGYHSQQEAEKFHFNKRIGGDLSRKGIIHPFAVKSEALALGHSRVSMYSRKSGQPDCSKSVSR